jgi:hypothetical protein
MNPEIKQLLEHTIEKWNELLNAMRRKCKANDRAGIADFVRRAAKKDGGAVQLAVLALLGLSLGAFVAGIQEETRRRGCNQSTQKSKAFLRVPPQTPSEPSGSF